MTERFTEYLYALRAAWMAVKPQVCDCVFIAVASFTLSLAGFFILDWWISQRSAGIFIN